ncbi:SGNH/GDSL hydrolase family protein [Prevotella sp. 10(H)]|uniref:SGNH/GDSL hydrolase family protein n=1 Tax=Prevotella sp. 10(H) TaxID=1158294 RepID=UPI0004A72544|nr:SGNH/GDSL hydrolase family protein [Prevotella sp. 10(H)]
MKHRIFIILFGLLTTIFGHGQSNLKIVILGSSSAQGAGPRDGNNAWVNRYRNYVQSVDSTINIYNLAKGGYTTYKMMPTGFIPPSDDDKYKTDIERNIDKTLELSPDAIILNFPTNDIANGFTVEEQVANYKLIIDMSRKVGVKVWLTTAQPHSYGDDNFRKKLKELNIRLKMEFGELLIDFWTLVADNDGKIRPIYDSGDGVHLSDAAHGILCLRTIEKGILSTLMNNP